MRISKMMIFIVMSFFLSEMITQNLCLAGIQREAILGNGTEGWQDCDEQPCWVIQERNLRCVGGFTGAKNRTVMPKLLFRSAGLNDLTGEELNTLVGEMGLKTVVDFRSTAETIEAPEETELTNNVIHYPLAIDSEKVCPDCAKIVEQYISYMSGDITAGELEDVAQIVGTWYPDMVIQFSDKYRQYFLLIADPYNLPLLFHCSQGKDRTGVAAALTLKLLGVSNESIVSDYMASWNYPNVVYPEWLEPLFNAVDGAGGIEPYLRNVVGVDAGTLLKIRQNLTPDDDVILWRGSFWQYNSIGKYNFSEIYTSSAGINDGTWKQPSFDSNNKAWTLFAPYGYSGFSPFGLLSDNGEFYSTPLHEALSLESSYADELERMYEYIEDKFSLTKDEPVLNGKFITYYFSKTISAPEFNSDEAVAVNIWVDDGFILYFNGHEVLRWNMPQGDVNHFTLATRPVDAEWKTFFISNQYLQSGENLIAVEVHQAEPGSSDIAFDLELSRLAYGPATIEFITDSIDDYSLSKMYVEARQNDITQNYIFMEYGATMSLIPGTYDIVIHADGYPTSTYNALSLEEGESVSLGILLHEEQNMILSGDTWQYWPSIPLLSSSQVEELNNSEWYSDIFSVTGWFSVETPLTELDIPRYQFKFYDKENIPLPSAFPNMVGNILRLYKDFVFDYGDTDDFPFIKFRFRTDSGDGLFAYLNGKEIDRLNIDEDKDASDITLGSRAKLGEGPSDWQEVLIDPTSLNRFSNTIAVDIRQHDGAISRTIDEETVITYLRSEIEKEPAGAATQSEENKFLINNTVVQIISSSVDGVNYMQPGGWQDVVALSSDIYFDAELFIPAYIEIYPYYSDDKVNIILTLVDEEANSVSGASILINNKVVDTVYSRGKYMFTLFPGEYDLSVQHSDYVDYNKTLLFTSSGIEEKSLNVTLYGNDWKPEYNDRKFEEPQVLVAGFTPSLAESGDIITLWALVRPGRAGLSEVELKDGNSRRPLKKNGILLNGDELWTITFKANQDLLGNEEPLLALDNYTILATDSSGLTSPEFPKLGTSDFGELHFSEDFQYSGIAPKFSLGNTTASAPQLTGCGCVPAFLENGSGKVELIAVVRKGDNLLDYVIWQDTSSAFELVAEYIGNLPNGDLIYSLEIDADSGQTDILSSGNTFRAVDIEGRESNACFEIQSIESIE